MYSLKIHETPMGNLIAACDLSILGRSFSDRIRGKEVFLNLKKEFYFEKRVSFPKVREELKKSKMANLVGEKLISELLKERIIRKEEIIKISGIPHVQIFVLE